MLVDKNGIKLSSSYITEVLIFEMSRELLERAYPHIALTDFKLVSHADFLCYIFEYFKSSKEGFLSIHCHF